MDDEGNEEDVLAYLEGELAQGKWTPVSELAGTDPEESVIEYPGAEADLPFFGLVRVEPRPDGRFNVVGHHGESDREWTAVFNGDDMLLIRTRPIAT